MGNREIIEIDDEKCDGCGVCIPNCAEGALQIVNGKARLISENLCDGIGMCLGHCPKGALKVIVREADEFDEEAVNERLKELKPDPQDQDTPPGTHQVPSPQGPPVSCGCPSSVMSFLKPAMEGGTSSTRDTTDGGRTPGTQSTSPAGPASKTSDPSSVTIDPATPSDSVSNLMHWPVKLRLVHEQAPFLKNADLLILADCAGVAMHDLHDTLLKDKAVVIFCPKFEDPSFYREKLESIVSSSGIRSITVAHMEVPCCYGLYHAVQDAVRRSGKEIPVETYIIGRNGDQRKQ